MANTKLKITGNNSFQKINNFHFFPYKSIYDQIWPWRKLGQGQASHHLNNYDEPETPILHTKFQGNWSMGSGEDVFFKCFYHVQANHIRHVTKLILIFISLFLKAFLWNLVTNDPVVSEENKL